MMKHLKHILLMPLSLLLMASECKFMDPYEKPDFNVCFLNNTDKTLFWRNNPWHLDSSKNESYFWSNRQFEGVDEDIIHFSTIPSKTRIEREVFWETYYFDVGEAVFVYIFDKETVETVPWDTIAKYRMVLHTYEITRAYLDAHDWTIVYPPDTTER